MKTVEEFERIYESLGDALVKHVSLSFKNKPAKMTALRCRW
jgi:hypothetical protein